MTTAIIFDLDGTLVDSAPSIAMALEQIRAARGATRLLQLDDVRRWVSLGAPELVRLALHGFARDPEDDLAEFRKIYSSIRTPADSVYSGAMEALRALAATGFALGLCSNKPQRLCESVLRDTGLAGLFRAVVGGDAVAHCKPHPGHLLAVTAALGVKPAQAIYVGDSSVDAQAARASRVRFFLASYGYGDAALESELADRPPSARLASLAELRELLNA